MTSSDSLFALPTSVSPAAEPSTASDISPSDWLAPAVGCLADNDLAFTSTKVPYNDDYLTPFPTTTLQGHAWPSFVKDLPTPITTAPPALKTSFLSQQYFLANGLDRPRSSPSTFGPPPETWDWPIPSGLGIQYPPDLPPVTVPGNLFAPERQAYSARHTPEIQAPIPRRPYQIIAPNPDGHTPKRLRDDDPDSDSSIAKRQRRTASLGPADVTDDDQYLVQLKEIEGLPWKDIATRFSTEKGRSFQIPALQMRYKRLREKLRVWEEQDINALKLAHGYWNKYKWDIISQKMTELGSSERWPARSCARKWQEFEPDTAETPGTNRWSTESNGGPMQFGFLPIS